MNKPLVFYSPLKGQSPSNWGPQSDFFKIIRKDYVTSHHASLPDGEYLYHSFCELVSDVSLKLAFTPKMRDHYLLTHTLRILYVYRSRKEFNASIDTIKVLRKDGVIIFTQPVQIGFLLSLIRIVKLVRAHNINVIQGVRIPKWFTILIRFIFGTIFQYRMPISVEQSIHKYILKEDYLNLYKKAYHESVL